MTSVVGNKLSRLVGDVNDSIYLGWRLSGLRHVFDEG